MSKEKETKKMMEETFFRKHAKKIFVAGTIISIAGLTYISKKYGIEIKLMKDDLNLANAKLVEASGIALRSLYREKSDAEFEIKQLIDYINNLDPNIRVNKIINNPEAEKRIQELWNFIREIDIDIKRIEG